MLVLRSGYVTIVVIVGETEIGVTGASSTEMHRVDVHKWVQLLSLMMVMLSVMEMGRSEFQRSSCWFQPSFALRVAERFSTVVAVCGGVLSVWDRQMASFGNQHTHTLRLNTYRLGLMDE